ncbi:Glycosyl transferase group 1 [Burkholderia sp. 8Y]|uniref:glycosyltransferase family 4 protein n=1 Tax=Burkholderia sp. 8Y TaxID=2653133 RepID=UPI0012F28EED|nr:glycosyltransferase family 4 protein [Burkholderia sp. 8Y]VXC77259.1 Glycosyl transferase group 1 [Burkholderia sp. 8Y]
MKIAFVSGLYPPAVIGGGEIVLQTLVEGIHSQGHEVLVLTTKEDGETDRSWLNGVPVIRVPIKNVYWHGRRERPGPLKRALWHAVDSSNIAMMSVAREILQQERPDVLNVHATEGWSAGVLKVGKSLGIPTVQVLHSSNFLCPNSNMFRNGHSCKTRCVSCAILRIRHRSMSEHADAVIGVSRFILDKHLSRGYFSKAKHQVAIHNARDLPIDSIVRTTKTDAEPDRRLRFGFIGTLTAAKGIELLIQEFLSLGDCPAELLVAGTGKPEYEARLMSRYANSRIRFLGYKKQTDFLPNVDVLVVPSLCDEALGMVVAEAFAFGIPVIASRRGGIPEMVDDGANGCLFEPDRSGELTTTMASFINGERDFTSMSRSAKASAHKYLDVESWVEMHMRVNQDLVATHGA